MAGKDRLFAQFTLMNYLRGSRDRSVQEILEHLQHNTTWGRAQLSHGGPGDLGLRNVQNWLKDIRESAEFGTQIEYSDDPNNGRQHLYSSTGPTVVNRIMPVEEACTLLMAEKFLHQAIPADFYDVALYDLFLAANRRLQEHDEQPKHTRKRVKDYLKRIVVEQRGQTLVEHEVPYEVLGVISRAILEGKRIECRYRGKNRELHPFGIVLKSPKIYLLAMDDHRIRKTRPADLIPAQFLCARISNAKVIDRPNLVPDDFDAGKFVESVGLGVESHEESGLPAKGFTLKLRLFKGESDNLLQDVQEYPLSRKQSVEKERGTDNHILSVPRMRATHQLTEWIVARLDRVEVLAPSALRTYIGDRIASVHRLYT